MPKIQLEQKTNPDQIKKLEASLKCPLSGKYMDEPVATSCCGNVYEKENIHGWLQTHQSQCPCCKKGGTSIKAIPVLTELFTILGITKSALQASESKDDNLIKKIADLSEKAREDLAAILTCPITNMIFVEPLFSRNCGHACEEEAIDEWIAEEKNCPCCRTPMFGLHLFKIPLFNELIRSLKQENPQLSINQYFSPTNFKRALLQNDKETLSKICQFFLQAPEQFNMRMDAGQMPPAFYLAAYPLAREVLHETEGLANLITKETMNMASEEDEHEGQSIAYWFCIEHNYSNHPKPFLADKNIRDLIDPERFGRAVTSENIGITPLHSFLHKPRGRQLFITDSSLRKNVSRFSLNNIPKAGQSRNISPLMLLCSNAELRKTLLEDYHLQRCIGYAINVTVDTNTTHEHIRDLSPLFLIATKSEPIAPDLYELLHDPDIRAEISEEAYNKKTTNPNHYGRSPAGELMLTPEGTELLKTYPDLREKVSVDTLTDEIKWDGPCNGATLLHIMMSSSPLFELLCYSKNLQLKLSLTGLLKICKNPNSVIFGHSPLSILLQRQKAGWDFLVRLIRVNKLFQTEVFSTFKLDKKIADCHDLLIALHLYLALKQINSHLSNVEPELRATHSAKFLDSHIPSINDYAIEKLSDYKKERLALNLFAPLSKLLKSSPEILNLIAKNTSFLHILLEYTPGIEFIEHNPGVWPHISIQAWNCTSQIQNRLGTSAFFVLAFSAILQSNKKLACLTDKNIIDKILPATLYTKSRCNLHKEETPFSFLLRITDLHYYFNNPALRAKIHLKDLMSFPYQTLSPNRYLSHFELILGHHQGREILQTRINESETFKQDLQKTLNPHTSLILRNLGLSFDPSEASANLRPAPKYYQILNEIIQPNTRTGSDISFFPKANNFSTSQSDIAELLVKYRLANNSQPLLCKGLRMAVHNNQLIDMAKFLVFGADINAQDDNPLKRLTALHLAVHEERYEMIKLLIDLEAATDIPDADGKTAFVLAQQSNNEGIYKLFSQNTNATIEHHSEEEEKKSLTK